MAFLYLKRKKTHKKLNTTCLVVSTNADKIWDHLNENWPIYLIRKYQFFYNIRDISSDINFFVFNWNHFEMRLLNLRINFFYLLRTFCPNLGIFFLLSLRFGQISPLAFRWLTATSDRNAGSCNRIPSNYCLP